MQWIKAASNKFPRLVLVDRFRKERKELYRDEKEKQRKPMYVLWVQRKEKVPF